MDRMSLEYAYIARLNHLIDAFDSAPPEEQKAAIKAVLIEVQNFLDGLNHRLITLELGREAVQQPPQ